MENVISSNVLNVEKIGIMVIYGVRGEHMVIYGVRGEHMNYYKPVFLISLELVI